MTRTSIEHAQAIAGTWQVIRAVLDGEEAPSMAIEQMEVHLSVDRYEVRFGGVIADRGQLRVDTSTESAFVELTGTEGPNAGKTIPAPFQYKGDRLRLCYGLDGILPDDFTTEADSRRYLVFYKRKSEGRTD